MAKIERCILQIVQERITKQTEFPMSPWLSMVHRVSAFLVSQP